MALQWLGPGAPDECLMVSEAGWGSPERSIGGEPGVPTIARLLWGASYGVPTVSERVGDPQPRLGESERGPQTGSLKEIND